MTLSWLRSPAAREVVLAGGVAAGLTVIWLLILPHAVNSGGDTQHYLRLAENPRAQVHTPYTFRILTPLLANMIGGELHYREAFRLINALASAASGLAAYLITRRLGGTPGAAWVAMAGLLCLPGWLFYLHQPYLVDPLAMALLAWSMLAALHGWLLILPLLLVAAALARETVISFSLPLYMIMRDRWIDGRAAVRVALVLLPGVLATSAVQAKPTYGWPSTALLVDTGARIVLHKVIEQGLVPLLGIALGTSFGVWWALGLYGFRHAGRLRWLMIPVLSQFIVGGDWGRFCLYAFPVIIPAGAIALWRHPRRPVLLGLVGVQSLVVFVDLVVDGHPKINVFQPSTYISLALIPIAAVVLLWPSRTARAALPGQREPEPDPEPGQPRPETAESRSATAEEKTETAEEKTERAEAAPTTPTTTAESSVRTRE